MDQATYTTRHSEVRSAMLGTLYRRKILISIALIGFIVSSIYSALLWTQYAMLLSSITDILYALAYVATFFWIRQGKLTLSAYWVVLIASLQVTLGSIFFVGAETGFQLYFLTLPVVIYFLLADEVIWRKLGVLIYGCLCFIAGHIFRVDTFMAPIPSDIAQWIFIGNALTIFIIIVSALRFFSVEVLNAYQQQSKLVLTDKLTSIANLRFIQQYAPKLLSQADRYGHPMSLIHFDVDSFNQLNMECGRASADRCLDAIVKQVNSDIREADILARVDTDEFVILLPETGLEETKDLVARLKTGISALTLELDQKRINVSASFGYSCCDSSDMKNIDELISEAKSGP